eukprot:6245778-Amphidinium_carterae.1
MGPAELHQSAVFYAGDLATALHNPAELGRMDHMQMLVRRALHLQVKPSKMTIIVLHAERLLLIISIERCCTLDTHSCRKMLYSVKATTWVSILVLMPRHMPYQLCDPSLSVEWKL